MNILRDFIVSVIATAFFSIMFKVPLKALWISAIEGGGGYVVYDITLLMMHSAIMGYFAGTLFIAICSEILARTIKMPATVFIIPGIIPLVPGSGLYYTMMYVVQEDLTKAGQTGIKTLLAIVAMAMALVLTSITATGVTSIVKKKIPSPGCRIAKK